MDEDYTFGVFLTRGMWELVIASLGENKMDWEDMVHRLKQEGISPIPDCERIIKTMTDNMDAIIFQLQLEGYNKCLN